MSGELPEGWRRGKLGELGTWTSGGTPSRAHTEYYGRGVPWIKTGELQDAVLREAEEQITDAGLANSSAKRLPIGTLLVAMYGATIGRLGILAVEAATNQACAALLPNEAGPASIDFVFQYLLAQREDLRRLGQGGAQPNISQAVLKEYDIPLPPLDEQRRIVAKLEALQARSRRAKEALDTVPALLEKLRQSILAAAFRGDLTKDWRAQNPNVEPASELLKRIRAERRAKWEEAELAKLKAKGKTPSDDKWKAKYKEPEPVDPTGLPELPAGWCWASVDEVVADEPNALTIGPFGSDLRVSDYRDDGVPLVFVREIRAEEFGGPKTRYVSNDKAGALARHVVREGDLLMTKMGDPPGDTAVYPTGRPTAVVTADVIKLTPDVRTTTATFLKYAYRAPATKAQLLEQTAGVAQQKLSLERFRTVRVPLAPFAEQAVLVERVEAAVAEIVGRTRETATLDREIGRLDASILAKAFRGELVARKPEDP